MTNFSLKMFLRPIAPKNNIRALINSATTRRTIRIVEVGPRDGLQNEKVFVPTEVKVDLVNRLSSTGLPYIEVSSFVSPKWVPQLSDASEVFRRIQRRTNITFAALVPNVDGMNEALKCRPDEVAIFTAASETFCKRNTNCTIKESLKRFQQVFDLAKRQNLPVRGYISCVAGCPYEGAVAPESVARLTEQLYTMGCREISLGDTIGTGTPESIDKLLRVVLTNGGACPASAVAIHCHDTGGLALANIEVALGSYGITTVDTSIGGLGGCPYAGPGVPGNVSTESVVHYLTANSDRYNLPARLQVDQLNQIGSWIRKHLADLKTGLK